MTTIFCEIKDCDDNKEGICTRESIHLETMHYEVWCNEYSFPEEYEEKNGQSV